MKIVGFGDSFITDWGDIPDITYKTIIGEHYKTTPEFRGVGGSGPWTAFFDYLDYPNKQDIDVAIFAWSEPYRIYHPTIKSLNFSTVIYDVPNPLYEKDVDYKKIIEAGKMFYRYLENTTKIDYEMYGLLCMFDQMIAKDNKRTKFIHMDCFGVFDSRQENKHFRDYSDFYNYSSFFNSIEFKNGVQINPPLMYLSELEDKPLNLGVDTRTNHLGPSMHKVLANAIIQAIDNYELSKKVFAHPKIFNPWQY